MTLIDMVGHLSFLIIAFSLLMRDIILLRILSIGSGVIGIYYNFFVAREPLWVPIIWLTVFMGINVYMIVMFYLSNRRSGLSADDLEIWKTNFLGLTTEEFRRIRKLFDFQSYNSGDVLTQTGRDNHSLYFITSGQMDVRRDGESINSLATGDVIGEMSFLTEAPANADVIAGDQTKCIVIDRSKLRAVMLKHPSFHLAMTNLFNLNLIKKLAA
jgi:hypothetical protein